MRGSSARSPTGSVELLEEPSGPTQVDVATAVWDLVWTGHVTNDGLAPLRAWLGTGTTAHKTRAPDTARARAAAPARSARGRARRWPADVGSSRGTALAAGGGRWSLLPPREADPTLRAHALAAQLLDRHGILTRAVAPAEGIGSQFADVYKVLSALEQGGQVRRGYFVERLGGSQFALPGAVDRLRVDAQVVERADDPDARTEPLVVVLAATDPANPYGASLPWPTADVGRRPPARPQGRCASSCSSTVRSCSTWNAAAARCSRSRPTAPSCSRRRTAWRSRCAAGTPGRLTIARVDGVDVLGGGALHGTVGQALVAAGFAPTPRGLRLPGQS